MEHVIRLRLVHKLYQANAEKIPLAGRAVRGSPDSQFALTICIMQTARFPQHTIGEIIAVRGRPWGEHQNSHPIKTLTVGMGARPTV